MTRPLIRPDQVSQLRAAAQVLRDLYDEGYIDFALDEQADRIDRLLSVYGGVAKAPTLRSVT